MNHGRHARPQVMQQQTAHAEDRVAMLEIIQSKGEELLRREEEGKTMRLLYESEVGAIDHLIIFAF